MAEKREYAYYQGCSLEGTASAYDASIRLVMKSLGVTLAEPADWSDPKVTNYIDSLL